MKIKNDIIKHHIIIEGLWGLGKTQIAKKFSQKYGYKQITEPLHTDEHDVTKLANLNQWYIQAYSKREKIFNQRKVPIIAERSLLSVFAFSYALNKKLPDLSLLTTLRHFLKQNKIQVVYLKVNENDRASRDNTDISKYSKDIQSILTNEHARARYGEWYEEILPRQHGILCFTFCNIGSTP